MRRSPVDCPSVVQLSPRTSSAAAVVAALLAVVACGNPQSAQDADAAADASLRAPKDAIYQYAGGQEGAGGDEAGSGPGGSGTAGAEAPGGGAGHGGEAGGGQGSGVGGASTGGEGSGAGGAATGGTAPPPTHDAGMRPPPERDAGPIQGLVDPPPIPAYSGGACPMFTGGPTNDTALVTGFPSGGDMRAFRMIVPENYDGSEAWPLMFAWHWLNASASSFVNQGELESTAAEMRFLIVVPEHLENANGDKTYFLNWPFAEVWGADKELQFFDDMLACVNENFNIDPRRVHGVGVSAGALWLAHLSSTARADHLASVVSLSGGFGQDPLGVWNMMYTPQAHKFPAIVLWGGPTDNLIIVDFQAASIRMRDAFVNDHHFVVTCTHESGHAVPPIDAPADGGTRFRFLWRFMAEHPFGLPPGESPWQDTGLPPEAPAWCQIATP